MRDEATDETPTDMTETIGSMMAGTQSATIVLMKPGADYDPHEAFLRVWSDTDWAGSAKDRKSQSRLKLEVDGCPLYSASRKQKAHAHSSGEAEHHAATSTSSEAIRGGLVVHGIGSSD